MPKIQIDGVGTVEVDDNFMSLPPDQQQRTVEEIAASAKPSSPAPQLAPGPAEPKRDLAPSAPPAQRNPQQTFDALGKFVTSRYPNAKITSGFRSEADNRMVGGAKNSFHKTGDAIDVTGLNEGERNRLYTDLTNANVKPNEFMFHKVKGGALHLHLAADQLPEGFDSPDWGKNSNPILGKANSMFLAGVPEKTIRKFLKDNGATPNEGDIAKAFAYRAEGGKGGRFIPNPDQQQPEVQAQTAPAPTDEGTWGDTAKNAALALGKGAALGAGGLADLATQSVTGLFSPGPASEAWNPGLQEMLGNAYKNNIGEPEADTTGERYLNAAAEFTGSAVVPFGPIGKLGKTRKALEILGIGAGGGIAGEAAHDVAPSMGWDPDTARTVGQVVGGIVGGVPAVAKPIGDARFVNKRLDDPRAPFAAKAVERMDEVAQANKPNGVFPKGRGPLSVEQINSIGKQFLNEVEPRLADMNLSDLEKAQFRAALKRRADLTPEEISALEGTPTGDAIAEGIRFFQTTRTLTPGYNGYKPGPIRRAMEMGLSVAGAAQLGPLGAVLGPMVRRAVRGDPSDLNMSRLDAGRSALKRKDAWKKIGDQTGADQVGSKTSAFVKEHEDLVTAREAEAAATAEARAETQAARETAAGERRDKSLFKEAFPSRPNKAPEPTPAKPSPTVAKAASALKKLEERVQVGSTAKAIDKLNAPPKPKAEPKPKARPAIDRYVEQNIADGVQGNYNAYADTLGVERGDVLQALRNIKTDDIDPFEVQKLVNGYKLSPAGRAALIPRLQKQLKDSGVADFRAKKAAAPTEAAPKPAKPAKADKATEAKSLPAEDAPAAPTATNVDAVDAPEPPPERGNYKRIIRKDAHAAGTERIKAAQQRHRDALWTEDSGLSSEILEATKDDVEKMISHHRTAEEAMRYFDDEVMPRFDAMGRAELNQMRPHLERMVREKRYHTVAEFEREAKTSGKAGRPRKRAEEYPDPASDPDYVPF